MKILVFAHQLEIGGTQVNAIDLAASLRESHGHDVRIFASPGPLTTLVRERALDYTPAPEPRVNPSPARITALRTLVRRERPDVIQAWDWPQALDAYYGVHLPWRVPLVVSDMCMSLTRVLPMSPVTTFGTPELVDEARAAGRRRVDLLLPPVDVHQNAPGAVDGGAFRRKLGIDDSEILLVTVSRFDKHLKSDSLLRTIEAVRRLGRDLPIRLALVGDGALRPRLCELAQWVNADFARPAVMLPGAMLDPRPAYAAADILIGMGGSALRGLAFAKPVIVVGKGSFAEPLTPSTVDRFYYRGMYGVDESSSSCEPLVAAVRGLCGSAADREQLGQFGRRFVVQHFALEVVSARLAKLCRDATEEVPAAMRSIADAARTAAVWLRERRFVPADRAFVDHAPERHPAG